MDERNLRQPAGFERLASARPSMLSRNLAEHPAPFAWLGLILNVRLDRVTGNTSPAALANAK